MLAVGGAGLIDCGVDDENAVRVRTRYVHKNTDINFRLEPPCIDNIHSIIVPCRGGTCFNYKDSAGIFSVPPAPTVEDLLMAASDGLNECLLWGHRVIFLYR